MKNYLFIIRAYNDIDHFTPILDHILANDLATVHLYSSVPLQLILPNENLEYLKNKYKLQPTYLFKSERNILIRFIERNYASLVSFNANTLLPKSSQFFLNHFIKRMRLYLTKIQERKLINNIDLMFDNVSPNLVVYDWTNPSLFPYNYINKVAKGLGVPTISIPHGLNVFLNKIGSVKNKDHGDISYYVSQGELSSFHLLSQGVNTLKIAKLGSARFETYWYKRRKDFFKKKFTLEANGKIKIAVFMNKLMYGGKLFEIMDMISTVKSQGCIVIKPHTRNMRMGDFKKILKNVTLLNNSIPSQCLIEWCDIGIVWGSSIGIDLLHENKAIIYPKFVHNYDTIYEKYLPNTVAKDTNEMSVMINKIKQNNSVNYSDREKKNLLKDIVYAGSMEMCVIDRYTSFFENVAVNKC